MFSRKKVTPPRRTEGGKALMAQMGFMTSVDDMVVGSPDDDDDDDLEAELRALQGEGSDDNFSKKKAKLKSPSELEKMISMSMKDIPSDEDLSDTEDPELMAELDELMSDDEVKIDKPSSNNEVAKTTSATTSSSSPLLQILQGRIDNYNNAIVSSKLSGDSTKVRRYERGLKTLEDMVRQARANKPVSEADIPPTVAVAAKQPPHIQDQQTPLKILRPGIPPEVVQNEAFKSPVQTGITSQSTQDNQHVDLSSRHLLKPQIPPRTTTNIPPNSPPQILPWTTTNIPPNSPPQFSPNHPPIIPISPKSNQNVISSSRSEDKLNNLRRERDLFKSEALNMKKLGNSEKAVEMLRASKQYDLAIHALEDGHTFSEPLTSFSEFVSSTGKPKDSLNVSIDSKQGSNIVTSPPKPKPTVERSDEPVDLLDGLMSRMNRYKEAEQQANIEGNSSKARRMARIVKQYEDSIKLHKKGQPCDLSELPCPPGFPPFQGMEPTHPPPLLQEPPSSSSSSQLTTSPQNSPVPAKTSPKVQPIQRQASSAHSRAEQQATFLEKRQHQFKKAAIQAKTSGDLELAKKYMRMAKGFDQMIEASHSGLPVDLSQIPTPPGEESDFVFVETSDFPGEVSGDAKDVYKRLQDDLGHQIKISETNRDMFTKLGDISSANKFEKLREGSSKDLESLKNAFQHGDPVPRFHYDTKHFSMVRCCPDLGDNDLEVSIVRGLNFNPPSGYTATDLHTFVKFEFPFPDVPQVGDTAVVKGTDSPEFNFTCKLEVKRKSRSFLRLIKSSKAFKFDVYYRRGFLKSDKLLGSVAVKLQPLEDKCVYHETFDLMDGRKAVGGKLEIKIRIRDPFVNKQVDETKEKWLIIDDFIRNSPSPMKHAMPQPMQRGTNSSPSNNCISVLMYEKDVLDQQVLKYQNKLKPSDLAALRQKSDLLQKTASNLKSQLQTGGSKALQDYLSKLRIASQGYAAEVKSQALNNATDKIKIILTKKTLVDKEIESVSKKLQSK